MPFDKKTLIIPDSTIFEEHNIVTNSDVIISDRTNIEYGIITDTRVFIGERVNTNGSISAKDDIRIDMFSAVKIFRQSIFFKGSSALSIFSAIFTLPNASPS